jgi:hypothetical protein
MSHTDFGTLRISKSESQREHVPTRACMKCLKPYIKSVAEEQSDPTACPLCGWKPSWGQDQDS